MIIKYKNAKIKKECTDLRAAKKAYNEKVAEGLHAVVNFIENAESLIDVKSFPAFNLHPLQRERKGTFAIDLAGRRSGFRLIIEPVDKDGEKWKEIEVKEIYKLTEVVIFLEVTNHYE